MTFQQFKDLKVGDRVYIPDRVRGPRKLLSTEVLAIDRVFSKAKVLLGRKAYSYRYIQRDVLSGWSAGGLMVGMC